jgi:hypothetical protein
VDTVDDNEAYDTEQDDDHHEEAILTEEMVTADEHEYEHVASDDDLGPVTDQTVDTANDNEPYDTEQDDGNHRSLSAVE